MAKTQAAPAVTSAPAEEEAALTLDEFCARLSETERRVALIAGFHFIELCAGHGSDKPSAYRTRFSDYASRPIG